ncbi:MAG: hypothetical protein ACI8QF_002314 [Limisphaerales bacterium]|jgi:hypothetical protein
MSHHAAIQVDWFGPFSEEAEARVFAKERKLKKGLYVKIGNKLRQRGTARLQYIGKSETGLAKRIGPSHHKLPDIVRLTEIWLGEIGSFAIPKEKGFKQDTAISLAESLHASYVKKASAGVAFALNEKQTIRETRLTGTVVNHWWNVTDAKSGDSSEPFAGLTRAPHEWWPYIIDYYGSGYCYQNQDFEPAARLTWLDGSFDLVRLSK